MVDGEDSDGDSSQTSGSNGNKYFRCCRKIKSRNVACVSCGSVYYDSCVKRKNFTEIDEFRIICCKEDDLDIDNDDAPAINNANSILLDDIVSSSEYKLLQHKVAALTAELSL
ncbi:hypothetical protein HHI36_017148 [Cryptolaemus montrouzieri]|uniref:Uncharacterized protein n=1 Tax=Cryptolaemus montrouzieri TaxID=559131 RepID=A0ABD2NMF7_9CUCU